MENNTNLASEFYVASILWRLGFDVSITLGHTKEVDLFARKNGVNVVIDVKATRGGPFLVQTRLEQKYSFAEETKAFYIFVHWKKDFSSIKKNPTCFIVPSKELERFKRPIEKWKNKTSDVLPSSLKEFEGRWDLLEKD